MPPPTRPGPRGKQATRRSLLARRDALSERDRAERSARIADAAHALIVERVAPGATVALYAAKGSEVDASALDAALRADGFAIAYPRVVADVRELAFHVAAPADLQPARFGLREPAPASPALPLAAIAAFVVPGLAFDRGGGRIGWGRGHYDATFAQAAAALRVGLAFEPQLVERVPREAHDVLLQAIVTEAAVYEVP